MFSTKKFMTTKPTIIYLVRHGQSVTNLAGTIGGQSDPELTDKGREQAAATKAELSHIKFDEVYSSDLQRATETAAIIYGETVSKQRQLSDLRERRYGELEGKPNQLFDDYLAALLALSPQERWTYRHLDSVETDQELVSRFMRALKEIAEQNSGKTVLIVAHGAAIRTVLIRLGFGHYEDMPPRSFKNGGYVVLTYEENKLQVNKVSGIDQQIVEASKK